MSWTDENIAQCEACSCVMDVTMIAPFTNVECPECQALTRANVNVGNYVLTQSQGVGGMSLVFRAMDSTLGREIAIKILNESYSMDAKRIEQFEKEAQITAAISHPNVVRVYTVGQAYQRFYIAMELVPGDSLEQKMADEGALQETDVLRWGREVCEGLNAANEAGLIHRDIKPGNILLDAEGHVKIVDFGLALMTQGGKVQAEEIWATPYYVPPETLDVLEEDFRSDIYALGASLFHALSGKPPFDTESRSVSELKAIKSNLPSLKELAPHVGDATCIVIDKAMAFDRNDRYSCYTQLISDLHEAELIASGSGDEARFIADRSAPVKVQKSNGGVYGAAAVAFLMIGGGLGAMTYLNNKKVNEVDTSAPELDALGGIGGSNDGGEVGKRLSSKIDVARKSLKEGDLSSAAGYYGVISRDRRFSIDSIMWGGLQSSILYRINGESANSRSVVLALGKLYEDMESKGQVKSANELTNQFSKALSPLLKMQHIDPSNFEVIPSEPVAMVAYCAALKNWEEGYLPEAMSIFHKVEAYVSESGQAMSEEFIFYSSLIPNYKGDYDLMKPFLERYTPSDKSQIETRQGELKLSKGKLQSKGRAVDNFNEWLVQLGIHKNRLAYISKQDLEKSTDVVPPESGVKFDDWNTVNDAIQPDIDAAKFRKALTILGSKNFKKSSEKNKQKMMMYLFEQADEYKKTLNKSLGNGVVSAPINLKNGKSFKNFTGVNRYGITVKDGNTMLDVRWGEVTTLSMIDLVKVSLTKEGLNEFEKNKRLEQAIAYAYLGGEKEKAGAGAESLGKSNLKFKKLWSECRRVLEN